jgi:hypothetical protein
LAGGVELLPLECSESKTASQPFQKPSAASVSYFLSSSLGALFSLMNCLSSCSGRANLPLLAPSRRRI